MKFSLLILALLIPLRASAQPAARFSSLGLPAVLTKPRLESLLQGFVSQQIGRSFQALGDERDFDHGHLLFDKSGRPVAILYHTREDTPLQRTAPRSWLQWIETGAVEDAALYERKDYPQTAAWQLFVRRRLPELKLRGTVTDEMLDPAAVPVDLSRSIQWVFTRVACGADSAGLDSNVIRLVLPGGSPACLSLSAS